MADIKPQAALYEDIEKRRGWLKATWLHGQVNPGEEPLGIIFLF